MVENRIPFQVLATDDAARTGVLKLSRGTIRTPAFMPVGTAATVKGLLPEQVRATGADVLLCNTYHLMLRPTAERIDRLGGLHRFMNWERPILTDSGGFQVMSLAKLRTLTENGVTFQSHIDGSRHHLTPERAVDIQTLFGSDIQMQLDECLALPAGRDEQVRAMELSLRWGARAKAAFGAPAERALFGIVQGGDQTDLRRASAAGLVEIGFDGYAIGGLAVGEPQSVMLAMLDETCPVLPGSRPRYLMGAGTPDDILKAVARGIDMFDCVMPARAGRHGQAFTRRGRVNLRNARHADDPRPLDEQSECPAARDYSRAYLHHLFKAGEMLGQMLLTAANLHYYQSLMQDARAAILAGGFEDYRIGAQAVWKEGDIAPF